MDWSEVSKRLKAPLPVSAVKWRISAKDGRNERGQAICYTDRKPVMDRLDEVVGTDNWQDEFTYHQGIVICKLNLRIEDEWLYKSDGAGHTNVEGEKGACTDAFKRAAAKWGVGRYLWDMPKIWVPIERAGSGHRITKEGYKKLDAALERHLREYEASLEPDAKPAARTGNGHAPQFGKPAEQAVAEVQQQERREAEVTNEPAEEEEKSQVTYREIFEACAHACQHGEAGVKNWIREQPEGPFPSLNSLPRELLRRMAMEFLNPDELRELYGERYDELVNA